MAPPPRASYSIHSHNIHMHVDKVEAREVHELVH